MGTTALTALISLMLGIGLPAMTSDIVMAALLALIFVYHRHRSMAGRLRCLVREAASPPRPRTRKATRAMMAPQNMTEFEPMTFGL
ncbi:MAG: hypothetical protein L0I84_08525 [Halomonas subglaciescola]|nr:hypothetical protein [Halomonas subglaciescola]